MFEKIPTKENPVRDWPLRFDSHGVVTLADELAKAGYALIMARGQEMLACALKVMRSPGDSDSSVVALNETTVVVTALDKLIATVDGKSQDIFGRVTFVLAKRETGWKIVHFHRSAMPA